MYANWRQWRLGERPSFPKAELALRFRPSFSFITLFFTCDFVYTDSSFFYVSFIVDFTSKTNILYASCLFNLSCTKLSSLAIFSTRTPYTHYVHIPWGATCPRCLCRNLALAGGVLLLLAETWTSGTSRSTSLFAPLPTLSSPNQPATYLQLSGRLMVVLMFLTTIRIRFSFFTILWNVVGASVTF